MGRYFGIAAVDLVVMEDFGKVVSYRNGKITAVPLEDIIKEPNIVDIETQYDIERYNGRRTILGRTIRQLDRTNERSINRLAYAKG